MQSMNLIYRAAFAFGVAALITVAPMTAMAGAPLKGVDVKLGKNPGSKPAARSQNQPKVAPANARSGIAVSDPGADGSKPKKPGK